MSLKEKIMKTKFAFWPALWASGILVSLIFTLDIIFGLLFPNWWVMQFFWEQILPDFVYLSWGTFFLGVIESFGSGVFIAAIYVPLYNLFLSKKEV